MFQMTISIIRYASRLFLFFARKTQTFLQRDVWVCFHVNDDKCCIASAAAAIVKHAMNNKTQFTILCMPMPTNQPTNQPVSQPNIDTQNSKTHTHNNARQRETEAGTGNENGAEGETKPENQLSRIRTFVDKCCSRRCRLPPLMLSLASKMCKLAKKARVAHAINVYHFELDVVVWGTGDSIRR